MLTVGLAVSLALSLAALTSSLLLWFLIAPKALADIISRNTQRVVVPGEIYEAMTKDDYGVSARDIENPAGIGTRANQPRPQDDESDWQ